MPEVSGLLESALYVENVDRSVGFYQDLFGFEVLVASPIFCALGVAQRTVLLLFEKGSAARASETAGGVIPAHHGQGTLHLAFAIASEELQAWRNRLRQKAIPIESEVRWPRGGHSLYFRDPDEHLLELVTPGCWEIY